MSARKRNSPAAEAPAAVAETAGPEPVVSKGWRPMRKSVAWALTVLARQHRADLGERLAELGLFPGQEQLLQALHENGAMTMGALAGVMQVKPPTASKAVARLSAQGLVERCDGDGGDARTVRVILTEPGRQRAAAVAAAWWDAERRLVDGFGAGERKKLRKALRRAGENFGGEPEDGEDAGRRSNGEVSSD